MAFEIETADRIYNRTPPRDANDHSEVNAIHRMTMYDKIVNGDYRKKLKQWTNATRPGTSEIGEYGYNTDSKRLEIFDGEGFFDYINSTELLNLIGKGIKGFVDYYLDLPDENISEGDTYVVRNDSAEGQKGFYQYDGVAWIKKLDIENEFIELNDTPAGYEGQAGKILGVNSVEGGVEFVDIIQAVNFLICDGTSAIAVGIKGDIRFHFKCEIQGVTLLADQSGDLVIDIWKDTYANFAPTVDDTVCAAAKPTITAGIKSEDTILAGWTKTINEGDILRIKVDSCSTITGATLILKVKKV